MVAAAAAAVVVTAVAAIAVADAAVVVTAIAMVTIIITVAIAAAAAAVVTAVVASRAAVAEATRPLRLRLAATLLRLPRLRRTASSIAVLAHCAKAKDHGKPDPKGVRFFFAQVSSQSCSRKGLASGECGWPHLFKAD